MSELIAFMAHRKAPNQFQDSAKDRMKEIEECNAGGSSAFKAIYNKMTKYFTINVKSEQHKFCSAHYGTEISAFAHLLVAFSF